LLQERVVVKVEDQTQIHLVVEPYVITEQTEEIPLVLAVEEEHKLQEEMVVLLGQEHLLVVKQEH
jgi:hypothetical protein